MGGLLHLIRMLNLFPSVGIKVVKHYTTVEVHRSFPQGVVILGDPYGVFSKECAVKNKNWVVVG